MESDFNEDIQRCPRTIELIPKFQLEEEISRETGMFLSEFETAKQTIITSLIESKNLNTILDLSGFDRWKIVNPNINIYMQLQKLFKTLF